VIGNIPFVLVGGIAALWLRGMNLNLSALIGFIALFGVAMLNGVVLVSSINQLRLQGEKTYRCGCERRKEEASAGTHDRLCCQLRLSSHGDIHIHRC
jgi:Cu/Ag efflux pump CusA